MTSTSRYTGSILTLVTLLLYGVLIAGCGNENMPSEKNSDDGGPLQSAESSEIEDLGGAQSEAEGLVDSAFVEDDFDTSVSDFKPGGVRTGFDDGKAYACIAVSQTSLDESIVSLKEKVSIVPEVSLVFSTEKGDVCVSGVETERAYKFELKETLRLQDGGVTPDPVSVKFSVDNLPPLLDFADEGSVLARGQATGIEIIGVNVEQLKLELVRIPERRVIEVLDELAKGGALPRPYELRSLLEDVAAPVWSGNVDLEKAPNKSTSYVIPIQEVLEEQDEGIFVLFAADSNDSSAVLPTTINNSEIEHSYSSRGDARWLIHTNLAGSVAQFDGGMLVSIRHLDSAKPVGDAKIELITRNNDIVFEGETNRQGLLELPTAAVQGEYANAPSHIVVRSNGDWALLDLRGAALDLSGQSISGRRLSGEYDAYVYTDRGIYRGGETIYVNALVRDRFAKIAPISEVNVEVRRPNGSIFKKYSVPLESEGAMQLEFKLPSNASHGDWSFTILAPEITKLRLGSATVAVADFVPEKLKVTLQKDKELVTQGQPISAIVQADFLYGAPGANLTVESRLVLKELQLSDYANLGLGGYLFGDSDNTISTVAEKIDPQKTDATGRLTVSSDTGSLAFPIDQQYGTAAQPLSAVFIVDVQEPGGRTTGSAISQIIAPSAKSIAIRPEFDGSVDTEQKARFKVKRFDSSLEETQVDGLQWEVTEVYRNWYYDRSSGQWRSEERRVDTPVVSGDVSALGDSITGEVVVPALEWGDYELTIVDRANNVYARQSYYSGWSNNAADDVPDFLEVRAQKKTVSSGDKVKIGVVSPYDGLATITVWSGRLIEGRQVMVEKGENSFLLDATEEWFPGAYVAVQSFRPLASSENTEGPLSADKYLPVRAMGVVYLHASDSRVLDIKVAEVSPGSSRTNKTVQLRVENHHDQTVWAVVQAVDEGILQLTQFATPAPENHFLGKRALGTRFYDDYNKLARADGIIQPLRTGGDTAAGGGGGALPVVPTKSVVLFAGPVKFNRRGEAEVQLDIPDFNGALRVMASAWTKGSFGSSDELWVFQDPVVAEAVMPRYIAPGDASMASLLLANTTQIEQIVTVTPKYIGAIEGDSSPISMTVAAGERTLVAVPIRATVVGEGAFSIDLQTAAGFGVSRDWRIYSRYAGEAAVHVGKAYSLPANSHLKVPVSSLAGPKSGGQRTYLLVERQGGLNAADSLSKLIAYRWTCSEQTLSKAGPVLLAYKSTPSFVEGLHGNKGGEEVQDWIQENIDRIISRQDADGSIGLWSRGDRLVDPLTAAELVGFLAQASLAGYAVPPGSVDSAYTWAYKKALSSNLDNGKEALALSTLIVGMSHYSEKMIRPARTMADRLHGVSSQASLNIAVALKILGDDDRSNELTSSIELEDLKRSTIGMGYYRDETLSLLEKAERLYQLGLVQPAEELVGQFNQKISTKKETVSLRAHGAIVRTAIAAGTRYPLDVLINGEEHHAQLGGLRIPIGDDEVLGVPKSVEVRSKTDAVLDVIAHTEAIPAAGQSIPGVEQGIKLSRKVYTLEGKPSPTGLDQAKVNDQFVVVLEGELGASVGQHQISLYDPIPAGYQIEQAITSENVELYPWLGDITTSDVSENRDDLFFVAYLVDFDSWRPRKNFKAAYVVRATNSGAYVAVQPRAENMYRPTVFATTPARPISVLAQ